MLSWVFAALVGAVPLYFGFAYGRGATGLPLATRIGLMLSLVILGLMVANTSSSATIVLGGVMLAYIAGVGVMGTLAGALARLVLGPTENG